MEKKKLGWGFKAYYDRRTGFISIFNNGNNRIAVLSPDAILKDADVFYNLERPTLKEWWKGLFVDDLGYNWNYLKVQNRKIYKYRYHVIIGCTKFTYGQLAKIILFAEKYKS